MKLFSNYFYLALCLAAAFLTYDFYRSTLTPPEDYHNENNNNLHLQICRNKTQKTPIHLNYLGPNLVSNLNDSSDLILCPGDAFGDLNTTYVTLQNCYLAMYHQDKLIWSSSRRGPFGKSGLCAASLQRYGELVLYDECLSCRSGDIRAVWISRTGFHPEKTELRIQGQQLQIVQTSQDGNQSLFYAGKDIREFRQDLGPPKQVAKEFLIKNHSDPDGVILGRNEYIGDLNGIHLIFQSNCELQLMNNNRTIWSFAGYLRNKGLCTLRIQDRNSISIESSNITGRDDNYGVKILPSTDFTVLQSNITFKGDQLLIIQTLEDRSKKIFYSEPGQDNGLILKKELRQIAKNKIILLNGDNYDDGSYDGSTYYTIGRLNYIGDLDGLHLILQEDCAFVLANGQQELWKLRESPNFPLMECFIQLSKYGYIKLERFKNHQKEIGFGSPVFSEDYDEGDNPINFQLSLENNLMVITSLFQNETVNIYHAGANTKGTWFQFIPGGSLVANILDKKDQVAPEMSYIGDINGVFTTLDKKGNWILYNKTRVIWESGTTQEDEDVFDLVLKRGGNVAIRQRLDFRDGNYIWSTKNPFPPRSSKRLVKTELRVNNDGMWLIHAFNDGTENKFKALEGTNSFALMSNEEPVSTPQTYEL